MRRRQPPPAPALPPKWERSDPVALAAFDPATKVCTMNCGQHIDDPRSAKECKFQCGDCQTVQPPVPKAPPMTHQSSLDRVAVPAMTVEKLALHLIDNTLEWVQAAAKEKPEADIKAYIYLDVTIKACDLIDVARKHGLLPPALDKRLPVQAGKPLADTRWLCLVCGSNRPGHHGAMEDGTPCVNGGKS